MVMNLTADFIKQKHFLVVMYTALPAIEKAKDSVIAKTIGTFIMGAGTALAYTNVTIKAEDIREKLFDIDGERTTIPHYIPQRNTLGDSLGEIPFDAGMLTVLGMEALGITYSINKLSEGQLAQGLVYPVAKVVTHGLAWLVDKYSKR